MNAEASSNPNLFVSAENPQFKNHFAGSMVVEVVVNDPDLNDTGQGKGEPDVTINGQTLRMVQATDGNWYAYFANVAKAKNADSTVGLAGKGLDFGVFCSRDTPSSVFGISLSETDGFAVPKSDGLTAFTNGDSSFVSCMGSVTNASPNLNNVVRNAKSINTNPNISTGQIGLNPNAWPLIQLYSFDNVKIQYNPGGPSQQVLLEYDDIPNISISVDRTLYPSKAEVFLTVNDIQLNQDPTDEDSWTFSVGSNLSVFYQAFDDSGSNSANGGAGLVDLVPHLSSLGFEDNGKLSVNLGAVLELTSNDEQPDTTVSDGTPPSYSQILTLVESGPNSGIFDNVDDNDKSTLRILGDAPRGQSGSITYNEQSISVLTGSSTATFFLNPTLTIGDGLQSLKPGTKYPVVLVDPDQNFNSDSRDHLDVFSDSSIIPTLKIGSPITLAQASDVDFFTLSTTPLNLGNSASSSVPDPNSARLVINTASVPNGTFEKISLNLGVSASDLQSLFIDDSISNSDGTNWLNYDFRSFANDLEISDFSDTSIELSFGSLGTSPVTIVDSGGLHSAKGFVQLDDSAIQSISGKSGTVYVIIDFGSSNDVTVSSEVDSQPVVFDLFSFGIVNSDDVNNSIYRFELEETSDNSSTFDGTLEYSIANQLNILDPAFIKTIQPIDDQIKLILTNRLVNDEGISISYSDITQVGVLTPTSTKSQINTNSGILSSSSHSYRFGQPVTITLHDPDLNLKSDLVDIYFVINDPNSENVDTVGKNGIVLLEVLIKDIRYKRCTVDGVEHGGLGATGFTLVETGPSTGIFKGVFKMPSKICNKSGTALISSAGGSLDVKYYDSRDSSGNANIFSLLKSESASSYSSSPQLSAYNVVRPTSGNVEEIILSGSLTNHKRGMPLDVMITSPDGTSQNFGSTISDSGGYRAMITINENSLFGTYEIQLSYNDSHVKTISFLVSAPEIPDWFKNNAKQWSSASISDSEFIDGIEYLIDAGIITTPVEYNSIFDREIPDWFKNNAKWWVSNKISDKDFVNSIQYLVKKGII